ncbi:MAG: hypothetical protein IPL53_09475 [Ignavibacteria bacterium]|nr:hypothetical protein [Ignavibacteria bacterium]
MVLDANANIYITGNLIDGGSDYVTLRYNTNGEFQWFKTYDGGFNKNDEVQSICVDRNKNVYVTGISYNNNNNYNWATDFLTIKYSQTNPAIKVNLKVLFEGIYFNLLNKLLRRILFKGVFKRCYSSFCD